MKTVLMILMVLSIVLIVCVWHLNNEVKRLWEFAKTVSEFNTEIIKFTKNQHNINSKVVDTIEKHLIHQHGYNPKEETK